MGKSGKKWENSKNPLNCKIKPLPGMNDLASKDSVHQGVLFVSWNLSQLIGRQRPHVHSGPVPGTDQIGPRTAARFDTWFRPVLIPLPDGRVEKNRGADGLLEYPRPGRKAVRKNRPKGDR